MSEENVEIVRSVYEAFGRGDAEKALTFFDPGVVLDASHRVDGGVGRGREELAAIVSQWMAAWSDWRDEVEEYRDLGDRVLVLSTQSGRGRGSGVEWKHLFAMLFEVKGRKITRWTIYDDLDQALEAAGPSE